jgi:hypothetical protein
LIQGRVKSLVPLSISIAIHIKLEFKCDVHRRVETWHESIIGEVKVLGVDDAILAAELLFVIEGRICNDDMAINRLLT